MDGSVVAYASNSPAVWKPTFQQNPKLNNRNHGTPGSVGNLFNARLEMTTTNAQTNYYLFGADGSLRHYKVQKFPIQGTNSTDIIQRERPYLQSWRDSRTNGYTFFYGTDTNRNDYGHSLYSLKTRGLPVTPEEIAALPACTHADIESYYAELWRTLSVEGRLVLQLLAACRL